MTSFTEALAGFVCAPPPLPLEVRLVATRMIRDATGCAIAGAADGQFGPLAAYARAAYGDGSVPAPGGRRLDPGAAAFVLGSAAHLLDYDDVHTVMGGHPSAVLLPVAHVLGYLTAASGRRAVTAFAVGAEVAVRIGSAVNPRHHAAGWHPTGVVGTLAAAACGAHMLGLDIGATRRAFGFAASFAGGIRANFGTHAKPLHAGAAARAGVESALLAASGGTASECALDEQFGGFCELFAGGADRGRAMEGVGERFLLLDPPVAFKLLPCCGSTQAAAWAAIRSRERGLTDPGRIRRIRVATSPERLLHTDRPRVASGLEGKFSMQYCVALGAAKGVFGLADFTDEAVRDATLVSLMQRVDLAVDPGAADWADAAKAVTGSRGAAVEIELDDGSRFRSFVPSPRGYPADPADDAELHAKFIDCATRRMERGEAGALAKTVAGLDDVADVRPMIDALWPMDAGTRGVRDAAV